MRRTSINTLVRLALLVALCYALIGCEDGDSGPTGSGILTGEWLGSYRKSNVIYVNGGPTKYTFTLNHEGSTVTGTQSGSRSSKLEGTYNDKSRTLNMVVHFDLVYGTEDRNVTYVLDESGNHLIRKNWVRDMPESLQRQ